MSGQTQRPKGASNPNYRETRLLLSIGRSMPMNMNIPPELEQKFKDCKDKVMADGTSEESAYGICYMSVVEGKSAAITEAAKHGFVMSADDVEQSRAIKSELSGMAVKAVGDWELDVTPVPFGSKNQTDSDGQWFDNSTDIMPDSFSTPLVIYQHGIKQGGKALSDKPEIVGKSIPGTLQKQSDGWHIRVALDKTKEAAKSIMDAAYKRAVAVSSDSIAHLARLDIGGKTIMYEKNRPGRIAVWPLAGFSLWEMGGGNFQPANRQAVALPAMKAMYREAGLVFPDISSPDTSGTSGSKNSARAEQIRQKALTYLNNHKD